MAPLGPAPEMVGKLRSRKWSPAARNASRPSAAAISVGPPPGARAASRARDRGSGAPFLRELLGERLPFTLGALAGKAQLVARHRRQRRWRLVAPHGVERVVVVERLEAAAGLRRRGTEALDLAHRMEARIVG